MRRFFIVAGCLLMAPFAFAQMKTGATRNPVIQSQPITVNAEPALETARRIERDAAIKMVHEKKAIFVDVRPKEAYDSGHIKGSINIPLTDLLTRLKEIPPNRFIITYCA